MDYQKTLAWMFSRLPMYQRQGSSAFKKDLTNILAFSKRLGQPEKKYPSIHVAGTNGKGSTSHLLASVLQESGYKVGLYTSPHLKDFRERIKINNKCIPQQDVVNFIGLHQTFLEHQKVSFFELTVGMAFAFFAQEEVDIAVIEVGLGGRLDSTNIVNPLISVITNIGLDHTQFLGETLPEIAGEKGGIIKPDTPVVIGESQEETIKVFKKLALSKKAPIYFADQLVNERYKTDLIGDYQLKNVKTAIQTIHLLRTMDFSISSRKLEQGLMNVVANTGLKGRWQVLGAAPKIICDTAHNKEGLSMVLEQLKKEIYKELHFVLGVVNDKSLEDILSLFPKEAHYYFCKPDIPRGLDAVTLQLESAKVGLQGNVYESVDKAYQGALKNATAEDLVYIGGSTFVVAELPL